MAKGTKTGGRSKGTPNKTTQEFKEALNGLLEHSAPHLTQWLDRVAQDDPAKALDTINKYIEYVYPKLARAEHQTLDKDGNKADASIFVKFE